MAQIGAVNYGSSDFFVGSDHTNWDRLLRDVIDDIARERAYSVRRTADEEHQRQKMTKARSRHK